MSIDGAVPVSDRADLAGGFLRLQGTGRSGGGADAAGLAEAGRGLARRANSRRADDDARRRAHHRRHAGGVLRLQRRRKPAGWTEPRLFGDRATALVLAAAGIDRLRSGGGVLLAGDGVPDRARSADAGARSPPNSAG